MRKAIKRYMFFICAIGITMAVTLINNETGFKAFDIAGSSFIQMITVLPPIMIMLGLMDVWVPRETMIRYMGKDSGLLGISIAIIIGSIAAGPMYAAFPFTAVMIKKGVRLSNIIIFMNAWCVTKITTLMFEISALGYSFTLVRFLIDLPGIIVMGYMVEWMVGKELLNPSELL